MRIRFRARAAVSAGICVALALTAASPLGAQPPAAQRRPYSSAEPLRPVVQNEPTPSSPQSLTQQPTYPIDLPTALRMADANNPTVGVARARVRGAVAQFDCVRVLWYTSL